MFALYFPGLYYFPFYFIHGPKLNDDIARNKIKIFTSTRNRLIMIADFDDEQFFLISPNRQAENQSKQKTFRVRGWCIDNLVLFI